jgi:hypothetical protein
MEAFVNTVMKFRVLWTADNLTSWATISFCKTTRARDWPTCLPTQRSRTHKQKQATSMPRARFESESDLGQRGYLKRRNSNGRRGTTWWGAEMSELKWCTHRELEKLCAPLCGKLENATHVVLGCSETLGWWPNLTFKQWLHYHEDATFSKIKNAKQIFLQRRGIAYSQREERDTSVGETKIFSVRNNNNENRIWKDGDSIIIYLHLNSMYLLTLSLLRQSRHKAFLCLYVSKLY